MSELDVSRLDEAGFTREASRHRRGLLAHCYRMLGSFQDAEDTLQEAMLKAWRGIEGYEGRASLQSWLYRIATNASLDALRKRRARTLPHVGTEPGDPAAPRLEPVVDPIWLEPFPDALLPESSPGPEAQVTQRQSITLAFLVVIQRLPPRQRAVLLLRDVLGYSAAETSDFLEMTVAAANSALQRARAGLGDGGIPAAGEAARDEDATASEVVRQYVAAWESGEVDQIVALLKEDAAFTMPPLAFWLRGAPAIRGFLAATLLAGEAAGRLQVRTVGANGSLACALYGPHPSGELRAQALQVLRVDRGRIAEIHAFLLDGVDGVLSRFGLEERL